MPTNNKLKIAFVLDDGLDPPNGVQQYVLDMGRWLTSKGHQVHYLVGETKRKDIENIHVLSRNVKVRFNGNTGTMPLPTSSKKIKKILFSENFDILHVQMPYSPFFAHKVIKLAPSSTKIIGTFHIAPNTRTVSIANTFLGFWVRKSLSQFDKFLSVSSAAQDFAYKTFKIDSEISPNVVDIKHFNNSDAFDEYRNNQIKILFLGRLVPRKGCQILLESIKYINENKNINLKVIICGKGEMLNKLREYTSRNKLSHIVEFKGFISEADKPRYYKSANIAVFPSSGGESFGIVLLEAMAAGNCAVLAGDNPGYRSVMIDKPELLFSPKNTSELSSKLMNLIDNPDYLQEVIQWGNEYIKKFDVNTVGSQLLEIYLTSLQKT